MTKIQATKEASAALEAVQEFTKSQFPVGALIELKRGKGLAVYKVVGYPNAISLDTANRVTAESAKGKAQDIAISSIIRIVKS